MSDIIYDLRLPEEVEENMAFREFVRRVSMICTNLRKDSYRPWTESLIDIGRRVLRQETTYIPRITNIYQLSLFSTLITSQSTWDRYRSNRFAFPNENIAELIHYSESPSIGTLRIINRDGTERFRADEMFILEHVVEYLVVSSPVPQTLEL